MPPITDRLKRYEFPPSYGPEWGSGGIFGLKFHQGVLYFTLAFEAEAHFLGGEVAQVYRFDLLGRGPGPRSGGDTYNAVAGVDDKIYFGGWVHAPAVYRGRQGPGGRISFENKFSHIHEYDVAEGRVRLLWCESLHHENEWAGEVSELIHDPVGDRLIVARADGHRNLGVFALDRRNGRMEALSTLPALKGTLHLDHICLDVQRDWRRGVEALQTIDLVSGEHRVVSFDYQAISLDGGGVVWPQPGCAAAAYSRVFFFVRGGVIVGDPLGEVEPLRFVRLLDFGASGYSPTRTMAKNIGGGILVAFNAYTHGAIHIGEVQEREAVNHIPGPSLLLYITPPTVRVVAALGARITGFERVGRDLLVATSNQANLGADDATPLETGTRDLLALDLSQLLGGRPPPLAFTTQGRFIHNQVWGGIPLHGYRKPQLQIRAERSSRLTIYEYDLTLPLTKAETETYNLEAGHQTLDLSGFTGIAAFRHENPTPQAKITIQLE
jgi:hypothetical protein